MKKRRLQPPFSWLILVDFVEKIFASQTFFCCDWNALWEWVPIVLQLYDFFPFNATEKAVHARCEQDGHVHPVFPYVHARLELTQAIDLYGLVLGVIPDAHTIIVPHHAVLLRRFLTRHLAAEAFEEVGELVF